METVKNKCYNKFFSSIYSLILALFVTALLFFAEAKSFSVVVSLIESDVIGAIGIFLVVVAIFELFLVYQYHVNSSFLQKKKNIVIVSVSVIVAIIAEIVPSIFLSFYFTPILFCVIAVTALIDKNTGYAVNAVIFLIFAVSNAFFGNIHAIYFKGIVFLAGIIIIFMIYKRETRLKFIVASFLAGIFTLPVSYVALKIIGESYLDALYNSLFLFGGIMVSVALYMLLVPIFEHVFKICTNLKLGEYCSFSSPLLKRMAKEAPGTFSHCLMVGNLAESCALAIGENPLLARTCAYYHDVGKIKSPEFFSENQKTVNPHDELIPEVSVSKISAHTLYGYEWMKKMNFPQEICNTALQHHGTMPISYFYKKAMIITEGKADIKDYSYSGPKPKTKINAIIMICDAAEAVVRARGWNEENNTVKEIIKERIELDQFSDCPITFEDLKTIEQTVSVVLAGLYHSRTSYKPRL